MNKLFEAVANVFRVPDLRKRVLGTLRLPPRADAERAQYKTLGGRADLAHAPAAARLPLPQNKTGRPGGPALRGRAAGALLV